MLRRAVSDDGPCDSPGRASGARRGCVLDCGAEASRGSITTPPYPRCHRLRRRRAHRLPGPRVIWRPGQRVADVAAAVSGRRRHGADPRRRGGAGRSGAGVNGLRGASVGESVARPRRRRLVVRGAARARTRASERPQSRRAARRRAKRAALEVVEKVLTAPNPGCLGGADGPGPGGLRVSAGALSRPSQGLPREPTSGILMARTESRLLPRSRVGASRGR